MASAACSAACRLGRGASDADISLRELYRRRVEAQQLLSVSQSEPGKVEPVAGSQGSGARLPPKRSHLPLSKAGQPSPSKVQLHGRAHRPTGSPPDSPSIAAFRPQGSPIAAGSQTLNPGTRSPLQPVTLQQGFGQRQKQDYQQANPASATTKEKGPSLPSSLRRSHTIAGVTCRPAPSMSPPASQRASPEPPRSEMSTVQRAVNAAIASSVELLLSSPPPCLLPQLESPVAFAPSPSDNGTAASPAPHPSKADGQRLAGSSFDQRRPVPSSDDDKQPLRLQPGHGDIVWGSLGLPVPPAVPSPPPQPCTTESFALEMRAALNPTFMTSRSRPIFCELDDPGSGIRFPSSRHGSRLQKFLSRLKACFVAPAHDLDRAYELDTAPASSGSLRQVSSPQIPQLAIPSAMAPLRRSMAGLPGEEAAAPDGWHANTIPAGLSTAAAAAALPPRPPLQPGRKHPSPPHADLLGLLDEPSEVIINIASPPPHALQPQQPNSFHDRPGSGAGSVCATPSEQMIALGLLSSRCSTPEGAVEDASPSQMPAKRCLMGLLKSGPQIFGTQQQQQQAERPQGQRLGEPMGEPPEAQHLQQQQQRSGQQTEPTSPCPAGLQQHGQLQDLQQAKLLQPHGHVLLGSGEAVLAGTCGAAGPEPPSAAELDEQEQHSSSQQADGQQQAKQRTPALQADCQVRSVLAGELSGAALVSQQQQEQQQLSNSHELLNSLAACHYRPSPRKQTGVAVRRTVVTLSQLLKAKAPTPPSAGKKRRRQPSPVPRDAAVRQSQNSKLLQAQRSLDAAKEAASRQQRLATRAQPAAGRKPFQAVNQQGWRDLSKPCYRSEALHAILSPVKAHQPRPMARQGRVAVQAAPGRVAGVVSAPTSPGLGAAGYATTKADHNISAPTSPAAHARKPPVRWTRAAAARAAAVKSKLQQQEGQLAAGRHVSSEPQAIGRKSGPEDASQLAVVAAALHAEAHELASPEKTARPHYQPQRSSTPAERRVPVFSGEAGVEPYSVQPGDRGKEQRKTVSSSVVAAHLQAPSAASEDDGSPVSMNKYQADRAQYLQVLQQLALGMDVSASTILPHKLPTPPPLPAEVLGEVALQLVQPRPPQKQQQAMPGMHRPTDSAETVQPRAVEDGSAEVPSLRQRAAEPPRAAERYLVQHNALVDEDDTESTSRTLVYSLRPSHSHSNELFEQDARSVRPVGAAVTQEAAAASAQQHGSQQKLVSIHAAVQRALSSREGSSMQEALEPESSAVTDWSGRGAVAGRAAGQQTVSKPARKQRHWCS